MDHLRASPGRATANRVEPAPKVCVSCGRSIEWRAKWARSWDEVRYCSAACRGRGVTDGDRDLERMLVAALRLRPRGASVDLDDLTAPAADTIAYGRAASADRESVRRAARRLADRGAVEWMRGGATVDPSTARGPVGIRLCDQPAGGGPTV
ncbi:MAG: DUF2256 domain-containing protein [Herbiconiux sp.]|nr:DUF2256 domain-containing protein [Herbiconiux sp.]